MPIRREKISVHVRRRLWAMSGHICACPICGDALTLENATDGNISTVGQECHINAVSPNGPRPFPEGTVTDPNAYDNWILLCPTHHKIVDDDPITYTADILRQWKRDRENEIIRKWEVAQFSFQELEEIITWLAESTDVPTSNLLLTPIEEKIARNNLSLSTRKLIAIGIGLVGEVENYIKRISKTRPGYAYLLLGPLMTLYGNLKGDGIGNDDVVSELVHFACGHSRNPSKWVAGIVLIAYFFERCDLLDS